MNRRQNEKTRDELLSFHYGCAADEAAVRERLATDPEYAALYKEVRSTATLLDEAASHPAPAVDFEALVDPALNASPSHRNDPTRTWRWPKVAAAAAVLFAALAAMPLGKWGLAERDLAREESKAIRLVVAGPPRLVAGSAASFSVETWDLEGKPRAADLSWRAFNPAGALITSGKAASTGDFDLRLEAKYSDCTHLELVADADGHPETVTVKLQRREDAPLVHLSQDKAVHRPGEVLRVRGLFLNRLSMKPRPGGYRARLLDPRGQALQDFGLQRADQGIAAWNWTIPPASPGGEYRFELRDATNTFAVETLMVNVQRFQPATLAKKIVLDRETYAAGAHGVAEVSVHAVDGKTSPKVIEGFLSVDGQECWKGRTNLDAQGLGFFEFSIPKEVKIGRAVFSVRAEHEGRVETELEPFFIPTGVVEVDFFPESGDFVAGLSNRLYASAQDALGRPVAFSGRIVDDLDRVVATVTSAHQGRARFDLRPIANRRYRLEFDEPKAPAVDLPILRVEGLIIRSRADGFEPGMPLELEVETTVQGPFIAVAYCRGIQVGQDSFAGSGRHALELPLPDEVAGVLRVTVFDADGRPWAERLLRRKSERRIQVEITPEKESLSPGETQTLNIKARDENGEPVMVVCGLTVVDKAVRDFHGERRIGLFDRAYFFADVESLEAVEEFMDDHPNADEHIDLLLGTQGWRRFAWVDAEAFLAKENDRARQLFVREANTHLPAVVDSAPSSFKDLAHLQIVARDVASESKSRAAWGLLGLGAIGAAGLVFTLLSRAAPQVVQGRRRLAGLSLFALSALALLPLALPWLKSDAPEDSQPHRLVFAEAEFQTAASKDHGLRLGEASIISNEADLGLIRWEQGPWQGVRRAGAPIHNFIGGVVLNGNPPVNKLEMVPQAHAVVFPVDWGQIRAEALVKQIEVKKVVADGDRQNQILLLEDAMAGLKIDLARAQRLVVDGPFAPIPLRVFAYQRRPTTDAYARRDFSETLYWNAELKTDAQGLAKVSFDTSDRVTRWSIVTDAHGAERVGQDLSYFDTKLPLSVDLQAPNQAIIGDRLRLPVTIHSDLQDLDQAQLFIECHGGVRLTGVNTRAVQIRDGLAQVDVEVEVWDEQPGVVDVRVTLGRFEDRVEKVFPIERRGYPHEESRSGTLEKEASFRVGSPEDYQKGSLRAQLKFYPRALDEIGEGLEGILQMPCGCFEQASATNYPNVLTLTYLKNSETVSPSLKIRAEKLLKAGYQKLTGYECGKLGYEWFGNDPGHESLSAYGLLEFQDMSAVYPVQAEMIERTRQWLLERRDGEGGFKRSQGSADSYGRAPKDVTDAYITYALALTGTPAHKIRREVDRLESLAASSEDFYVIALAAAGLQAAGRHKAATKARAKLLAGQAADGSITGSTTSITSSRARDLKVETTAFALLAWLDDRDQWDAANRAAKFLRESRLGNGRFGSTQATIMVLKALTTQASVMAVPEGEGVLTVYINGQLIRRIEITLAHRGTIVIDGLDESLLAGDNDIRMTLDGELTFPWTFDLRYVSDLPADDPDAALVLETSLREPTVRLGETVTLDVLVENLKDEGLAMGIAVVGLPAGLRATRQILEDLQKEAAFDYYERRGSKLVFYWRGFAPGARKEFAMPLVAELPGSSCGSASSVYLYYGAECKRWCPGLKIEVRRGR